MKLINMQGQKLPALGFGTWQLEGETCVKATGAALEIGYRHIDTAQIYQNESEVGQAIKNSKIKRDELFITTKVWTTNYKAADVKQSVDESLQKLKIDHVNLLLMHWPNEEVELKETLDAMQELMAKRKTKAIGVSNFPVSWMRRAVEECKSPIVCNQVEYHALLNQDKVISYARKHDIVVTAYSPLARAKLINHPVLEKIGKKYGKTSGQVALRWLIQQDGVAAIPKAARAENAKININIFDFDLDSNDLAEIKKINGDGRTINPSFAPKWD